MNLCPARFDAAATWYSPVETDDGAGGFEVTWTDKGTVWCHIVQSNANEQLDQDGLKTQRRVTFYTHYNSEFQEKDRISYDGIEHNIVSLTRVDKKRRSAIRGPYLRIDTDSSSWFGV